MLKSLRNIRWILVFFLIFAEKWKKLDTLIKKYTDQNSNLKKQIIQAKKKLEKKDKSI